MTPVNQACLYAADGIGNGDCLPACIASLLEVPLWMVPPFHQMFGRSDWRVRIDQWLDRFYDMKIERIEDHPVSELPEFYIANGPASRGVYHSVIYRNGQLEHDPHPSKEGLTAIDWCFVLRGPRG